MTPKERASAIVQKYKGFACQRCYGPESNLITAHQCALIAVEEIMVAIGWHEMDENCKDGYWDDVKNEIEKYLN